MGINSRKTVALFIALLILCEFCFATSYTLSDIPTHISTPRDIEQWFLNEFDYEWEMPDNWQAADRTIERKKGDCEDFAILTKMILQSRGIESDIVIVTFKGLNRSHVVCLWEREGRYSFMSNRELFETSETSVENAVGLMYTDWEKIIFTDERKQPWKVIKR